MLPRAFLFSVCPLMASLPNRMLSPIKSRAARFQRRGSGSATRLPLREGDIERDVDGAQRLRHGTVCLGAFRDLAEPCLIQPRNPRIEPEGAAGNFAPAARSGANLPFGRAVDGFGRTA